MRESREYVVRFGGARAILVEIPTHIFGILVGSVAVAVAFGAPPDSGWWWAVLCLLALMGGFSLWGLTTLVHRMLSRTIACRVDGDGITLSCPTLQVSWTDIKRIVLSRETIPAAGFPSGGGSSYFYSLHLDLRTGIEPRSCRRIDDWRLDEVELAKAVVAHAPHVGVVKMY